MSSFFAESDTHNDEIENCSVKVFLEIPSFLYHQEKNISNIVRKQDIHAVGYSLN